MTSREIEEKWQRKWDEARLFEAEPSEQEKYFVTFPYPYVNGFLHMGHALTLTRAEIMARYKRMRGYNVLFPFAFHATGTPIGAAAERVANREESQIQILRAMGIPEKEIQNFADPIYWVRFFPDEAERDVRALGVSADWRRKFITTSINPYYDNFIKWQFLKLREMGLIVKGSHPVVWCTHCNSPVGDHARVRGEGEVPQEFVLLKFRFGEEYIIAATLRPETVFGQTNLWVDPQIDYVRAMVDDELWIISSEAAKKLSHQGHSVTVIGTIKGEEMIGKFAIAPVIERAIPILPSFFCDPDKGTGIVTSVPSDAPDDWMGLVDLKRNPEMCEKYGLDCEMIRSIKPVSIIHSDEWGDLPAPKICDEMGIESQMDREKLEEAKRIIYKSGFYTGRMGSNCGSYTGMPVEAAREKIKEEMIREGEAAVMYELSNPVVCRCLTPSIVRIVEDQWFITYGNREWKEEAKRCLAQMDLYPESVRKQFEYVIDWLRDWACTREVGMGTRLPWDEKWVIESLSDSTIYMAFYTIAHFLQKTPIEKLGPEFFDYVFLGEGDPDEVASTTGISLEEIQMMRSEFLYWYPFDLRVSGKDLIQNHLAFCIFNHTAIFHERLWPKGFGLNGWILVDGVKMSKSAGNFYTLRQMLERFGADVIRITLAYGGEGIDDPNWDTEFANTISSRLDAWAEFAVSNYGRGRDDDAPQDRWFESVLQESLDSYLKAMDRMEFRTALKRAFFDLQREFRWYNRRCSGSMRRTLMNEFIELQTLMLAPFVPHIAEEIWERIGKEGFISVARIPGPDASKIDEMALKEEAYLIGVIDDVREILGVIKNEPKIIHIYTCASWKRALYSEVLSGVREGKHFGEIMKDVMSVDDFRTRGRDIRGIVQRMIKEIHSRGAIMDVDEFKILSHERDFLAIEFGCEVRIWREEEAEDPMGKAKNSLPMRPAIYVE